MDERTQRRRSSTDGHLDDVDRSIIEQLQADGRMPYTKLGAQVGLSEAAARQRVQRLVDNGVVQIVAVTNPIALGVRRMALIGLHVEGDTAEVAERLEAMPGIEYLVVTAGSFDLMCEVVVPDERALMELVNDIRRVPGVRSTESFIYLDIVKQTYEWGAH